MKKLFAVLCASVVLSACGEETPVQAVETPVQAVETPVQTVDWYKDHDDERQEMIAKCQNDVNARDTDSNCLNAEQAQIAKNSERRGVIRLLPHGVPEPELPGEAPESAPALPDEAPAPALPNGTPD